MRRYVRSLARMDESSALEPQTANTRMSLSAELAVPAPRMEQILQILLEGVRNIMRHSHAGSGALSAAGAGNSVRITIADDGVGFGERAALPWSIASRVEEVGGRPR